MHQRALQNAADRFDTSFRLSMAFSGQKGQKCGMKTVPQQPEEDVEGVPPQEVGVAELPGP